MVVKAPDPCARDFICFSKIRIRKNICNTKKKRVEKENNDREEREKGEIILKTKKHKEVRKRT